MALFGQKGQRSEVCMGQSYTSKRRKEAAVVQVGQLFSIFQKLGTPDESVWQGVSLLPDWQPLFPKWAPQDLQQVCALYLS